MDKDAIRIEFGEKIGRLAKSRAYLDFCEEVYGYRICLFNMMDREQIDYVLESIPIAPDDTVLDLGCGVGGLLARIVAKYGCAGVGIDLLDGDVMERHDGIRYLCGDIDAIADYPAVLSVTLSVDSLYFSSDLDRLVGKLARIRHNRLYFFYSQYLFDEADDKSLLQNRGTNLAKALDKAKVAFRTLDFCENERRLYVHMGKALRERERAFAAEGNADLYGQKLREVQLGMELFEKGRAGRYLYIAETG